MTQCCDELLEETPDNFEIVIQPDDKRRTLGLKHREERLKEQEWRCYYCELRFDSFVFRNEKSILLRIVWDHFVPYDYSRNNSANNFVAACQICNSIKRNLFFETSEQARSYIEPIRKSKGYM